MQKSRPNPNAGEVWYATMDPTAGREQAGFRPVVVVSGNAFNQLDNSLVVIVPITSRNRGYDLHVPIAAGNGGLPRDCVAMCDQLRAIDTSRLKKHQGTLDTSTLDHLRYLIAMILSDDPAE